MVSTTSINATVTWVNGWNIGDPEQLHISQILNVVARTAGQADPPAFPIVEVFAPASQLFDLAGTLPLHKALTIPLSAAHQRPRIDQLGSQVVCTAKEAELTDSHEVRFSDLVVVFDENYLFVGSSNHESKIPALTDFFETLRSTPTPLTCFLLILSKLGTEYTSITQDLTEDVSALELEVLGGDYRSSTSIYTLNRKILGVQQALVPLHESLDELVDDLEDDPQYTQEIELLANHASRRIARATEHCITQRELLSEILQVDVALVGVQQNDDTKKISAWAAILVAPTIIAGIYGMNFDVMPELHWAFGYPLAISLMGLSSFLLYRVFKRRDWL